MNGSWKRQFVFGLLVSGLLLLVAQASDGRAQGFNPPANRSQSGSTQLTDKIERHGDHPFFLPLALAADLPLWQMVCVHCPSSFWSKTDRSLQLDSLGHPHVVYGGNNLFYSWYDGVSWQTVTLDATPRSGYSPSLALDGLDQPHIAYGITDYSDPANYRFEVKYLYRDDSGWHMQTLEENLQPFSDIAIDLDSSDDPHFGFYDRGQQQYIYGTLTDGSWIVEPLPFGAELNTFILDSEDRPHIIYCSGQLGYAHWMGTIWDTHDLGSCHNASQRLSIVIDSDDRPHISHFGEGNLVYNHWDGAAWVLQTVDTNVIDPGSSQTAISTSIALNSSDSPVISYTDNTAAQDLKYAYWENGAWTSEKIDVIGSRICGLGSLVLDEEDSPQITCHDHNVGGLVYLTR